VPSRPATSSLKLSSATGKLAASDASSLLYSRRYLDWNRMTFEHHSKGSQIQEFSTHNGAILTDRITYARKTLKLNELYGCAPRTYCTDCRPDGDPGNIFTLINDALATVVVNKTRSAIPRIILHEGGNVRYDLVQGPFTYDDLFVVVPFKNTYRFIPDVPYTNAAQILPILNAGAQYKHKRSTYYFDPQSSSSVGEECSDLHLTTGSLSRRSVPEIKYQTAVSPGYKTIDHFGSDGDDTPHSSMGNNTRKNSYEARAAFPIDGSSPKTVDVVFMNFVEKEILSALKKTGLTYTPADVSLYMPSNFTSNTYLGEYAKLKWQDNIHDCPLGNGVGS
jgi:hypothetical protein